MDENAQPIIQNQKAPLSKKKIAAIIACIVLVIAVIMLLVLQHSLTTSKPAKTTTILGFRVYKDPWGYFKVVIPNSWTTSVDIAQGTTGIGTDHQATQKIEENQLVLAEGTGIVLQVFQGAPTCPLNPPTTASFIGYPASFDPTFNQWTVPTSKGTVIITISYPGSSVMQHYDVSQITPPPAEFMQTARVAIANVLKTLQLTNVSPAYCQ